MKQLKTAPGKPKKVIKKKAATASVKFKTVNEYISGLPAKTKSIAKELRTIIRRTAPEAEEVISYNIPAFKWKGMLIWFAAWKEHISIYPRTRAMEAAIKEISSYEGSKGTIKFPVNKSLPTDLLTRIVKFRMQENLQKAGKAGKK